MDFLYAFFISFGSILILFIRFACLQMIHIFLRLTDTDARQEKKSNQVRNGHEAVHDIRKNPDGFQLEERAAGNEKDKNQTVRENALRPHEINHAAFAIVVPAQDRRESKENKTD